MKIKNENCCHQVEKGDAYCKYCGIRVSITREAPSKKVIKETLRTIKELSDIKNKIKYIMHTLDTTLYDVLGSIDEFEEEFYCKYGLYLDDL